MKDIEFDGVPQAFVDLHRAQIETWIEGAIPGAVLCIPVADGAPKALLSPFVSAPHRVIELRARAAERGVPRGHPYLIVSPADEDSARLIESVVARLDRDAFRRLDAARIVEMAAA